MDNKPGLLYITDLYYKAKGRAYFAEDLYITEQLKEDFDLVLCHPMHVHRFEDTADLIVIRNSGPVIYYKEQYNFFVERARQKKLKTFNSLTGKGDMAGKNYLITLTRDQYEVIPTVDELSQLALLPPSEKYIIKPKEGADSIGLQQLSYQQLQSADLSGMLIQPSIDFEYEVSFYYIDKEFQYALYAPDKEKRWQLEQYTPTGNDLAFAEKFIHWNAMPHGIQRVDACRTRDGKLLLVELEDLNPFLSLDLLDPATRNRFMEQFKAALKKLYYSNKNQ